MKSINLKRILVSFLFFSLIVVGCSNSKSETVEKIELTIAAASDLTHAFSEIGKLFENETSTKVTFSFGSTGQLADQIENGAPFDVFASANKSFIEQLDKKNLLLSDTNTLYALGRIGIATKADSALTIETIDDLLKPEVVKIAIASPDHAPYGLASKQALETAGVWGEIESKLVFGRNISDTLTYIETGNAEVAIIALSLVKEDEVSFTLIDEKMHAPLEQMIAVVERTNHQQQSKEFIEFIRGPIGKPVMESYGFVVPTE
ncbi:molybdate ABC transporter substrate-binding protein [Bacillaceae bacterium IKA-2]|nr:molybdate ABC transporter substrate-binding protein [Bacillaceae bacterium IKA-2]